MHEHTDMHTFIQACIYKHHTCRLLLPHHTCTSRHGMMAQDALDRTSHVQKLGAYLLVAWAKQNRKAAVKETGPKIGQVLIPNVAPPL